MCGICQVFITGPKGLNNSHVVLITGVTGFYLLKFLISGHLAGEYFHE